MRKLWLLQFYTEEKQQTESRLIFVHKFLILIWLVFEFQIIRPINELID